MNEEKVVAVVMILKCLLRVVKNSFFYKALTMMMSGNKLAFQIGIKKGGGQHPPVRG